MCRGHDPLFSGQSALLSLPIYHHCAALMPPFSNFRKKINFQPCFGQNFSSQDANFPNFCSLASFFKENPLPRPYFWKPVWHTPTKKKLSAPPRARIITAWGVTYRNRSTWMCRQDLENLTFFLYTFFPNFPPITHDSLTSSTLAVGH